MFFDTAYLAKYYCNEPNSSLVRALVRNAGVVLCSAWALTEFHAVLHRHIREGMLSPRHARILSQQFSNQCETGLWRLVPMSEPILRRTSQRLLNAPASLFLRAGDALHLQTAVDAGERDIWTSDRHMLAAAPHFGLTGRSV